MRAYVSTKLLTYLHTEFVSMEALNVAVKYLRIWISSCAFLVLNNNSTHMTTEILIIWTFLEPYEQFYQNKNKKFYRKKAFAGRSGQEFFPLKASVPIRRLVWTVGPFFLREAQAKGLSKTTRVHSLGQLFSTPGPGLHASFQWPVTF